MSLTNKQRGKQVFVGGIAGLGEWVDVPYDAANFYASASMTWAVPSPLTTNRHCRTGNIVIWSVAIATSTVGGVVGLNLFLKAPTKVARYTAMAGYTINAAPAKMVYVKVNPADPGVIAIGFENNASFALGATQLYFTVLYEYGNPS